MSQEPVGAESATSTMPATCRQHEIAALEAQIAWHYAQITILKAKRNALAPICSLPNELLCKIFMIYAVESDALFNLKWTQIMYVCHHWHDLALATQPLWAFIGISWHRLRGERFYKQLRLSGAAPFRLKAETYERFYTPRILENAGRIQALELRGEASKVYDLIRGLSEQHFPILSSLDLDPSYKQDELPEGFVQGLPGEIFDGRMPLLRELVLKSIDFPWRSLRGLTTLCLTDCGDSTRPRTFDLFLAMLAACPQLHTLKLDDVIAPPLPEQHYPTVDLATLTWIRLRADATTCTAVLHHLRFPPTTSIHIFPYGVRAGPDVSDILVPLRKHVRSPGAPTPHLVLLDGSVSSQSSHYKTSFFCETASPDAFASTSAGCPFSLNSHPANEGELRRIMTKVLKAIPVGSITHLDARGVVLSVASWKAALRNLPALEAVYLTLLVDDTLISFFTALGQIEQLDREHRNFPRIRRLHIRVLSRACVRAFRDEPEEDDDVVGMLLTPLQTYLQAAFDNGNTLQFLELEDRDHCLWKYESELDALFPLIDSMVWDGVVYDPAVRKANRESWEVERKELMAKYGIEE